MRSEGDNLWFRPRSFRHVSHNLPLVDELLAAAPVGFALVDPDLRFVRINAALAAVHGKPPEAHLGRTVAEVLGPEGAEVAAIMREVLRTGRPELEREIGGIGGRRFLASYYPVGNPHGGPSGVGAMVLEITARSHAEAALRESREQLRIAQDAARMGTWEWDVEADRVRWSGTLGAAADLPGGAAPETWSELLALVHPEDRPTVERALERALETGADAEVEFRVPAPDGAERWINAHARPLGNAAGRPERVLGVAQDVSARKRVELAERRVRSLLNAIFDNAPVGLGFLDADLRYVRVNQALAEMHGVPAPRHIGRTPAELLPGMPDLFEHSKRVLASGRTVMDREISGETAAAPGERRHWLCNLYPVETRGERTGVGLVVLDVSDRRRTAERLALMAGVGTLMDLPLAIDERMERLAQVLVPALGEVCLVESWEDRAVRNAAVAASDPGLAARARELRERLAVDPVRLGEMLGTGPPVVVLDLTDEHIDMPTRDPDQLRGLRSLGARSVLVIALRSGGRPQGAIVLLSASDPHRYGEADRSLAEDIGVRASLGLENARLYEYERAARQAAERAQERAARLQAATAALARAADPAGVAAALVGEGRRALGGAVAAVWRMSEEGRLSLLDADGTGAATARPAAALALDQAGPLADALRSGAPIWVAPDDGPRPAPLVGLGPGGVVTVPIPVEGGPDAVLAVGFADRADHAPDDRELAGALGRLAGQALHRARLLARERDDRRRAEEARERSALIAEVGAALDAPLGVEARLERLARLMVNRLANTCVLHLLEDGTLRRAAAAADTEERLRLIERLPPTDVESAADAVSREGRARLYTEVSEQMMRSSSRRPEDLAVRRAIGMRSAILAPMQARGRSVGVLALGADESRPPYAAEDAALAEELAGRAALAIDNARLYERERAALADAERAGQRASLLAEVGNALDAELGTSERLTRLARLLVPRLADACLVELRGDEGRRELAGLAARDAGLAEALGAAHAAGRLPPDHAAATARAEESGTAVLVGFGAERGAHPLALSSSVVAPLRARGRVLGSLTLGRGPTAAPFGANDLPLVEELGRRAGLAVDNARLFDQQRHIAQTLQQSLLPTRLPTIPRVAVAGRYLAAGEGVDVGGDFYDLFEAGGAWLAVMGDVCGKGPEAAALTALSRHTIRAEASEGRAPREILGRLNEAILRERGDSTFLTATCVRLERRGDDLHARAASGGHPLPLIVRGNGRVEAFGRRGTLLGPFRDVTLGESDATLRPGDTLVLHTDGVTEARRGGVVFGEQALRRLLSRRAGAEPEALADAVVTAVRRIQPGPLQDDLALLVLRLARASAAGPRPAPHERGGPRLELGLPHAPDAARSARAALDDLGLEAPLLDDVRLLVSELVTNSVLHGPGGPTARITVRVHAAPEVVRVEVFDPGPGPPAGTPVLPAPDTAGGRGLYLVNRLADRWGPTEEPGGVWLELDRS
jgi:PAS domain S-box-containing protein